ncbi:MAG: biotin synthase BioB [Planctomycetes bacterium]|nr:biotin synthase BioB [Planctomycetota bacterium]
MTKTVEARKARSVEEVEALLARPLLELVFDAARVHREHHDPTRVQCSQLLSIKTGGCPEDCGYCSQSAHFDTPVKREPLMQLAEVVDAARTAKANGADRFCMGAAWREVKDGPEFERVLAMVREVKSLGLETCVTLGMLEPKQAAKLRDAGLDYYNHNLDTGKSHYGEIVHTRTLDDRLATLDAVRAAGIHVCSGGILGMGESRFARAELLHQLATLAPQPESVPINALVPVEGTPLAEQQRLDWTELVRAVAAARILMPRAVVRLSAGRTEMHEAAQALCFLAGANSIFVGDELLTTPNPTPSSDAALFAKLGLEPVENRRPASEHCRDHAV